MRFTDSSSSINSLFDYTPGSAGTATSTVTPVLSRTVSNTVLRHNTSFSHHLALVNQRLVARKLVVMLVGLPASGKSTVAKQLNDHINRSGLRLRIYNAGNVRRQYSQFDTSDFFNPNNLEGKNAREKYATINVNNMVGDLESGAVDVGFLDATNTTVARRSRMMAILRDIDCDVVVFDVQCTDGHLINFNIAGKAHNLDYRDKNYVASITDFKLRTQHYFKVYEPVTPLELAGYRVAMYMKLENSKTFSHGMVSDKFEASQLYGIISQFEADYYKVEGKRYYEAVAAFYGASGQLTV